MKQETLNASSGLASLHGQRKGQPRSDIERLVLPWSVIPLPENGETR